MNHIFGSFDMILIIISDQNIQYTLRPEGCENITLGFQVSDLCF